MNLISDEEHIFPACDDFFANMKDSEFLARGHVIKLWALAYHDKFDEVLDELEKINLNDLIHSEGSGSHIGLNEDSFFFLYAVIPNRLACKGHLELCNAVYEKMDTIKEVMQHQLVCALGEANRQCYNQEGDLGKAFYDKVMEGEYAEYVYTKELIGTYKSVIQAMRAKIFLMKDEMNQLKELKDDLQYFDKMALGHRYLEELGLFGYYEDEEVEENQEEA